MRRTPGSEREDLTRERDGWDALSRGNARAVERTIAGVHFTGYGDGAGVLPAPCDRRRQVPLTHVQSALAIAAAQSALLGGVRPSHPGASSRRRHNPLWRRN